MLAGYDGMLMTDGYAAWRTLDGPTHFGCPAHARRMFMDAMKGQNNAGGRAAQALAYFTALYQVETLARQRYSKARRASITGTGCASNTVCRCLRR